MSSFGFDAAGAAFDTIGRVQILPASGGGGSFLDGSEQRLQHIMEQVSDRSSGSDALAAHIVDWPTRYHLSRLRRNLLRPLALRPGMRILDAGAGTGALTRYLGETGAEVVALEGNIERARVAAARCAGLANVKVVCGELGDFEDEAGFDLAVLVGVLEHAAAATSREPRTPAQFLSGARRLTRPEGCVAIGIENQLGLKYLVGFNEDHLGKPWVGVEGYRSDSPIRTFSRRQLAELAAEVGFPRLLFLFPFPDYKLPTTVLHEDAYRLPDHVSFVDQLVGSPTAEASTEGALLCDDREAHRVFLEAGLGKEVANSFLLLGSSGQESLQGLVPRGTLAWHFGSERLRLWMRERVVEETPEGRGMRLISQSADLRERGWLSQSISQTVAFLPGETLERLALDACSRNDLDGLGQVLRTWRSHLAQLESPRQDPPGRVHPFLTEATTRVLPPSFVDVGLRNFVRNDDAGIHFIDQEWEATGGVDASVVVARALWLFAAELILSGAPHPWQAVTTVDELTMSLGKLAGEPIPEPLLARVRDAEAELQAKVQGGSIDTLREQLEQLATFSRTSPPIPQGLPFTRLAHELARLGQELGLVRQQGAAATAAVQALAHDIEQERAAVRKERAVVREERAAIRHERASQQEEVARLRTGREQLAAELADLRERRAVRIALALARAGYPASRLLGLSRRRPPG